MSHRSRSLSAFGCALGLLALVVAPARLCADTKLQLVTGSKEFPQVQQALTLSKPEILALQWMTDAAGAAGGDWQVTTKDQANKVTVVAKGSVTTAPAPGQWGGFTIAAGAFLAPAPPAVPRAYSITIQPHDAAKKPTGSPSAAVVVTQAPDGPALKFTMNSPTYPDIEFLQYAAVTTPDDVGTLRVRLANNGAKATDPVVLSATDRHFVVKSDSLSIPSLKPKASRTYSLRMTAHLPPPPSALYDPYKLRQEWAQSWHDKGVDLVAVLDWRQQEFREVAVYRGKTGSCQNGIKDGDELDVDCGGGCGCCFGREVSAENWRRIYGFQFGNTGDFKDLVGDYDLGDLQGLYGDMSIYVFTPFPVPSPVATTYLAVADGALNKGRCFGFSLAALRFYHFNGPLAILPSVVSNQRNAPAGPPCDTWHLKGIELGQRPVANVSPDLARMIKRQHALQLSAEALSCFLEARIHNSVDYLKDNLKGNLPALLSITQGSGGHCVVAHHVVDRGKDGFTIQCYDPNVPWDPTTETTKEAQQAAMTNSSVFVIGDSYVFNDRHGVNMHGAASIDLTVYPYSIFKSPSMPSLENVAHATIFGSVSGSAGIHQVTDAAGHTLYHPDGKVNYDPKTRILGHPYYPADGNGGDPRRYVVLDAQGTYTHAIAPTGAYSVHFIGPGYAVQLDSDSGKAGEADHVTVDAKAATLALATTAARRGVRGKLMTHAADKSTRVASLGVTLSGKAPVRLEFDAKREALTYRHAGASSNLSLGLWSSANHKATFSGQPIAVEDGDVMTIKPNWSQLDGTPGSASVVKRNGARSELRLK